jgi:hypothetical protein
LGNCPYAASGGAVTGEYVTLGDEPYYCIHNYDQMPPFFMTLVSSTDHWLFIASTSGLTAGRQDTQSALFPYTTDDKVTENAENTGNLAVALVTGATARRCGAPFRRSTLDCTVSPAISTRTSAETSCSSRRSTTTWT